MSELLSAGAVPPERVRREGRGRLSSIDMLPDACAPDISWALDALRAREMPQTEILREFNARLGGAAVAEAAPIVIDVIGAVAGWGPDEAPGVFTLGRAELVGSQGQALVYQIDFTLDDQLRITP